MGRLTATAVRGLRAEGRHLDGQGLALVVDRAGRRYWTYRYQRAGRERSMGLGSADDVSLADARKLHAEARALLLAGKDPLEERGRAELDLTRRFEDVSTAYVTAHEARWHGAKTAQQWRSTLRDYVHPLIGKVPVAEIGVQHVLKVLNPVWNTKPDTARRIRARLEFVLDYAFAMNWRQGPNPAIWRGSMKSLLPAPSDLHTTQHHAALDWRECPAFMARLCERDSTASLALALLILTAVRSGEVRGARWDEIDLGRAIWTIPADRMKAGREHRVPLSPAAMEIVRKLAEMRSGDLVFPGVVRGHPLSDVTLKNQLRQLGYGTVTVHGFRSTFRDWVADTGKPADLAEAALAHVSGSAVVRAYARSDLLEARRALMSAWADFLTNAVVVPLRAAS